MRFIVASLAFTLASCGQDLGTHRLVSVGGASELPSEVRHSRRDPGYVVLTFDTDANLNAEDINALYAKAGSCDVSGRGTMTAFGPFTDSDSPKALPSSGDRAPVSRYLVYMPVAGEIWGELGKDGKSPVLGTFDLASNTQDICIYLEHTGFPVATRTNLVRVAAPALKAAVSSRAP